MVSNYSNRQASAFLLKGGAYISSITVEAVYTISAGNRLAATGVSEMTLNSGRYMSRQHWFN